MKKFIGIFILSFTLNSMYAQMVKPASGFILRDQYDSAITLHSGDYIVQGEVLISKSSVLTIEPGTRIFFMPGATIRVNGGLHINGVAKNLVQLSSAGGKESGTGILVGGNASNADIKISYASFKFLIKPLQFEKDWYRNNVDIENSDFFNTYEFNDAVSIKEAEFYFNKQPLNFIFKNNVFADNYSNISVYNATSYRVKYLFENNVFANNLYFDSRSKAESNPLYTALDDIQGKFVMQMSNNAFSDNYIFTQDSLKRIGYGTVGFVHPKTDFEIQNNFTKNESDKKYSQKSPAYNLHAFPLELSANGNNFPENTPVDSLVSKKIKIHFNTPIASIQKDYVVFFNFIDTVTGEILKKPIDKRFQFTNISGTEADFSFDSSVITEPIGYISIENLKNPDGVSVPSINMGIIDFFKKCGSRNYKMEYVTLAPVNISKVNTALVDTLKNIILQKDSVIKLGKWEAGLFLGVSGYAGDLNHDWFHQDKWNTAFAGKLRYHYNNNISACLVIDYTNVGATDYGLYAPRKLNFKSSILSAAVLVEYNFNDKYNVNRRRDNLSLGKRLYPSFGIGLGFIKFNPKGKDTSGTWYDLRQFGTEGETLPGGKKYSLLSLTVPIQVSLNYRINKNFKIAAEFIGYKLFTDYLDDASKVAYVDDGLIQAYNPGNPVLASHFTKPGVDLGARGNPHDRDFFFTMGLTLTYRLNYRNKDKEDNR